MTLNVMTIDSDQIRESVAQLMTKYSIGSVIVL